MAVAYFFDMQCICMEAINKLVKATVMLLESADMLVEAMDMHVEAAHMLPDRFFLLM